MVYSRTVITAVLAAGAISSVLAVPLPGGGSAAPPTNSQSLSAPAAGNVLQPAAVNAAPASSVSRRGGEDGVSVPAEGTDGQTPHHHEHETPEEKARKAKKHPGASGQGETKEEKAARKAKKHPGANGQGETKEEKAARKAKKHPGASGQGETEAERKARKANKHKKPAGEGVDASAVGTHADSVVAPPGTDTSVAPLPGTGDPVSGAPVAPGPGLRRRSHEEHEEHEPHHHLDFSVFEKAVERVDHAKEHLRAAEEHLYELFHLEDDGEDVSEHRLHKAKKHVRKAKHALHAAKKHLKHIEHKFREKFGLEHHEAHHPSDLMRLGKALALASMGHSHPAPPPGLKSFGQPEEAGSLQVEIIAARGATVPPVGAAPLPAPQNAPPGTPALVPGQATPPVAGTAARRSLEYGFDLD